LILPYIDEAVMADKIDYNVSALAPANRPVASQILPFYRCPSYSGRDYSTDPLYVTTAGFSQFAIRNYVAMGAKTVLGLSGAVPADGIMFPGSRTAHGHIKDGTSGTILVAETREESSSVWIDGTTAAVAARWFNLAAPPGFAGTSVAINYTVYFPGGVFPNSIGQAYGPSSMHEGGAHHLMADGSVHFLNENLDVIVYDALASKDGGEVAGEF
jgi:hypothetical protein